MQAFAENRIPPLHEQLPLGWAQAPAGLQQAGGQAALAPGQAVWLSNGAAPWGQGMVQGPTVVPTAFGAAPQQGPTNLWRIAPDPSRIA